MPPSDFYSPLVAAAVRPLLWLIPLVLLLGAFKLFLPKLRGVLGEAQVGKILQRLFPAVLHDVILPDGRGAHDLAIERRDQASYRTLEHVRQREKEMFKIGDRVWHPKKPEWGIGEVIVVSGNTLTLWFEAIGEKILSMDFVQPLRLRPSEALSATLDAKPWHAGRELSAAGKPLCKNCGQLTQFGERADPRRVDLGWCDPCFKHSQRIFVDKSTGETRYFDELRTCDGIKSRWNPK